jgi:hypothetical protein
MHTELVRPRLLRTAFETVWDGAVDGARRGLLGCPDVWEDDPRPPEPEKKGRRLFYGQRGVRKPSTSGMSHWQARMRAEWRCPDCGGELEAGRSRCRPCLDLAAMRNRLSRQRQRATRLSRLALLQARPLEAAHA